MQASIGLSDQLTLGHVAELAQDDGIAMRLKFDGPCPRPLNATSGARCWNRLTAATG